MARSPKGRSSRAPRCFNSPMARRLSVGGGGGMSHVPCPTWHTCSAVSTHDSRPPPDGDGRGLISCAATPSRFQLTSPNEATEPWAPIATRVAERVSTHGGPKTTGMPSALLNAAAIGVKVVSTRSPVPRRTPVDRNAPVTVPGYGHRLMQGHSCFQRPGSPGYDHRLMQAQTCFNSPDPPTEDVRRY